MCGWFRVLEHMQKQATPVPGNSQCAHTHTFTAVVVVTVIQAVGLKGVTCVPASLGRLP